MIDAHGDALREDLGHILLVRLVHLAGLQRIDALCAKTRCPAGLLPPRGRCPSRVNAMQQQAKALAPHQRCPHDIDLIIPALIPIATRDYGHCREPIGLRRLQSDPTFTVCIEYAHG